MQSIEGKKTRLAAVDCLIQYFEAAVHTFLLSRELYPRSTFRKHQRFGQVVLICNIKQVKQFVKQFCASLQTMILHDRVNALVVSVSTENSSHPVERFFIEVPCDFSKTVFYTLPASTHKSDFETVSTCSELLRENLVHLERKLGSTLTRARPAFTQPDLRWEVYVDVERNSVQTTECMDMPSGWSLVDSLPAGGQATRTPIKSSLLGNVVAVSTYVDSFS